jgi:hypothetical protein
MKTKIILTLSCILILAAQSVDAKNLIEKSGVDYTNLVESSISYPSFAQELGIEGVVKVLLSRNDADEILVANVWGSNPRLVDHVKTSLNKQLKQNGSVAGPQKEKVITIRFNLLG